MFKVSNKRKQNDVNDVLLIVIFEHISHLFAVVLLLTLNWQMLVCLYKVVK